MPIEITPGIRLLRANNPSPLTERGTNTYLIGAADGTGPVAVIDPGPDDDDHLEAILTAAPQISHILLTHPHLDHSALIPKLKARSGAPTYAFGVWSDGRSAVMQDLAARGLAGGGEGLDRGFIPDHRLADGDKVSGPGWELTALHTPGHSAPHLAFLTGQHLLCGDLAMGWSSTLISPPDGDLGSYMNSLARLKNLGPVVLLPGHGDAVAEGQARLSWLAEHRATRAEQIRAALANESQVIPALAALLYAETPHHLHPAAERNIFAHLIEMHEKSLIFADPELSPTAKFALR